MRVLRKAAIFEAVQSKFPVGDAPAGSWLVTDDRGVQRVVTEEDFQHDYQPAPVVSQIHRGVTKRILQELEESSEPLRLSELAAKVGVAQSYVGATLKRLLDAGHVVKIDRGLYRAGTRTAA